VEQKAECDGPIQRDSISGPDINALKAARRRGKMREREIMDRREKLGLAFKTLQGCRYARKSVTERFRSEYPFLAPVMEEMLVEAQAFLKMDDEEFELRFLGSLPYDSFKVLISYYAEQELRKVKIRKREMEKASNHFLQFSAGTKQQLGTAGPGEFRNP
jgi:hypothetical protein